MIASPAPTILAGKRCLVRIAVTYDYREFPQYGGEAHYPGADFRVEAPEIIEIINSRERLALVEINARIVRSTGRASFEIEHLGRRLRVHAQQRASMEYARTRSPYALERALQLMDTMRDRLTELEEALFDPPVQEQREAVTQ